MSSNMTSLDSATLDGWRHDLRTVASILLGYVDSLDRSGNGCADTIASLQANGMYLLELIDQMTVNGSGKSDPLRQTCSLDKLVREVLANVRSAARDKRLDLAFDADLPLPTVPQRESLALKRVLMNLLSNAIKYSDSGCVRIRAGRESDPSRFYVEVKDQGPGLARELAEEYAKPPSQRKAAVRAGAAGSAAGNGVERGQRVSLGLVTSRALVESLGGWMAIVSRPGEGLAVRIVLPDTVVGSGFETPASERATIDKLSRGLQDTTPDREPVLDHEDVAASDRPRLLLVEDDPDMQSILRYLIDSCGMRVDVCGRGSEALMLDHDLYDGLLLDLHLPDLDGVETARIVRRLNFAGPIYALTAMNSSELTADARNVFDGVIEKSGGSDRLVADLRRAFIESGHEFGDSSGGSQNSI